MEAVTEDRFKLNHLRQRIAQMTIEYEDSLALAALKRQLLIQERDDLRLQLQTLLDEVKADNGDIQSMDIPLFEDQVH